MVDWNWEIEMSKKRKEASEEARKNGATKYWYYITSTVCPACFDEDIARERMYTPKPTEWDDRHHYVEVWNYCDI